MNQFQRRQLKSLFIRNKVWANNMTENNPRFFSKSAEFQHPDYLWIGCADSKVPASQIIDLNHGK